MFLGDMEFRQLRGLARHPLRRELSLALRRLVSSMLVRELQGADDVRDSGWEDGGGLGSLTA
jgi:hypothetical protein